MKDVKWYIFFVFIFVICILLFCWFKGDKDRTTSSHASELTEIIQNLVYYDAQKVPDIELSTMTGERTMLSEAVDELCVVIYLPSLGCSSCYEKELDILQNEIPDSLKCKVLVIGKFSSERELKLFGRKCKIQTFRLDDSEESFPIPFFVENPVAFLLNRDLLGFAFFDMVRHVDYSDMYYELVAHKMRMSMRKGKL